MRGWSKPCLLCDPFVKIVCNGFGSFHDRYMKRFVRSKRCHGVVMGFLAGQDELFFIFAGFFVTLFQF